MIGHDTIGVGRAGSSELEHRIASEILKIEGDLKGFMAGNGATGPRVRASCATR